MKVLTGSALGASDGAEVNASEGIHANPLGDVQISNLQVSLEYPFVFLRVFKNLFLILMLPRRLVRSAARR